MEPLKINEIVQATNGNLISCGENIDILNITGQICKIKKGSLFIAITKNKEASLKLINTACEKGAAAVISTNAVNISIPQIIVNSTIEALWDLCKYYRCKFHIPVVGITGSAGKTSTKDMLALVLSENFIVCKTITTKNDLSGTIETALNINSSVQAAIFELGFSGYYGFLKKLAHISRPNIGIITNISTGHYQVLGSKESILKAKMEITEFFDENSVLIINADDQCLSTIKNQHYKIVKISAQGKGDYNAFDINDYGENGTDFKCIINGKEHLFKLNTPGVHFIYSALACIAVGLLLDMDIEQIKNGISKFKPSWGRMNIIKLKENIRVINDSYNANLISMKAAADVLKAFNESGCRKILILGDMLEQGRHSEEFHRELGKYVIDKCDLLITVGKDSEYISEEAKEFIAARHFAENKDVCTFLSTALKPNDILMVKGSRAMLMEDIVIYLQNTIK